MVKPRHGAGSQATFLIHDQAELAQFKDQCEWTGPLVVQEHRPGRATSVTLLIGPAQTHPLPACWQHLSDDGRFRYLGGSLPLPVPLDDRARRLALRQAQPVSGLRGYVGVDLVCWVLPRMAAKTRLSRSIRA